MERTDKSTFSLRLRKENLRNMVRDLAKREGISQNELLEQAAEHEVIARGSLLADDLEIAAAHLRRLSATAYTALVVESVVTAAAAEGAPDPLRAHKISRFPDVEGLAVQRRALAINIESEARTDSVGAVSAFENLV